MAVASSRRRSPNPDHATLRLLASLPLFRHWHDPALPADITRWLDHADSQQLLTLAAATLHRLHRKPPIPRKPGA